MDKFGAVSGTALWLLLHRAGAFSGARGRIGNDGRLDRGSGGVKSTADALVFQVGTECSSSSATIVGMVLGVLGPAR